LQLRKYTHVAFAFTGIATENLPATGLRAGEASSAFPTGCIT
jgi:hypothetical protein